MYRIRVSKSTDYGNIVGGFGVKILALIVRLSAHDEVYPTLSKAVIALGAV